MIELTLLGEVIPKKNRWKRGRYGNVYLESKAQDNFDGLVYQAKSQVKIVGHCRVWMIIYTKTNRADLDGQITSLADVLEKAGTIDNDRNIKFIEATQIKVKSNPRAEIKIGLIDEHYEEK